MKFYEYKVIPAPKKGEKAKGAKTPAERFAHKLTGLMNEMGAAGWEYVRADTLPCEERSGLTGTKSVFQNMLTFRRESRAEAVEMLTPAALQPKAEPKLSAIPKKPSEEPHDVVTDTPKAV
ncbi:DUF4177 domain-containing protein (plasmid) [Pseudorhodobacter turbinis]|uniref:DUF4177 domain-containing protein n=1 Tax=Pseudorhodobacter turbinis TaxID=2500533 RepID=A0A4P8EJC2_9RHOB|nr:DUF4177 domain-containing protein [Pseudorhodobacter turbinis]